jgi:putative hydrolase of the HAD superfamily
MVLIFDLDDTLYDEITFVYSGFKVFSEFLTLKFGFESRIIYQKCLDLLENQGRGKIFDTILKEYNIYSKTLLKKCINEYRYHKPEISLFPDALRFISNYSNTPLYIVTDGNKNVQRNKINVLGLNKYIKKAYPTRQFGLKNEKPSPFVFNLIAQKENVNTSEIIYFGDNPHKDFIGLKPLGFKTIRLKRGSFSNITLDKSHEAHMTFNNFNEITKNTLISLANA